MAENKEEIARPPLDPKEASSKFSEELRALQAQLGQKRLSNEAVEGLCKNFDLMTEHHQAFRAKLPKLKEMDSKEAVNIDGMSIDDKNKLLDVFNQQGHDTITNYLDMIIAANEPGNHLGALLEKGHNLDRFSKSMELTAKIMENPLNADATTAKELQGLARLIDDKFNHTTVKKWAKGVAIVVGIAVLIGLTHGLACAAILPWAGAALTKAGLGIAGLGAIAIAMTAISTVFGFRIMQLQKEVRALSPDGKELQARKDEIASKEFQNTQANELLKNAKAGLDITQSYKTRVGSGASKREIIYNKGKEGVEAAKNALGGAAKVVEEKAGEIYKDAGNYISPSPKK